MYAIIETGEKDSGGKQFRVAQGDIIEVDLLQEAEKSKISFNKVKLFHDGKKISVGQPHVEGCEVHGEVVGEVKGPKIFALKYKRRKSSCRKVGHRQQYTQVKITSIKHAGKEK